ncbi:response regulator transcription factor [Lacticaseibacillus rhamnosus]|uniref:response regulator transcription factor n=1 Tax=Lacticaseibacillus rhamnosus TaxID=47715 RepID=UPI00069FB568|nr:response regulator transcription factor [Lacticaseibacillus rhamnosus]
MHSCCKHGFKLKHEAGGIRFKINVIQEEEFKISNAKILLVEDNREFSELLKLYLQGEGYILTSVFDGKIAMDTIKNNTFDVVLLDIMLPEKNGFNVLKELRQTKMTPVIIITARDMDQDEVLGLSLGADDYLKKPFSLVALNARIKAQIRRTTQYAVYGYEKMHTQSQVTFADLRLDNLNQTVYKNDRRLNLTVKEYRLLKLLMIHPGHVFSKQAIYEKVWGESYIGDENTVNVCIKRLRDKIQDVNQRYIRTVWGIGYVLEAGVE